ncbi:glycosyltransferase family 4 protein [Candidatus Omnitrophota bacterium]
MRILFIASQFTDAQTGAGVYARLLVEGVAEQLPDAKITVLCTGEICHSSEKMRFVSVRTPYKDNSLGGFLLLRRRFKVKVRELLQSNDYDIIHFTNQSECFKIRETRAMQIVTVHDYCAAECPINPLSYLNIYPAWFWFPRWAYLMVRKVDEKKRFPQADFVIAVSDYEKRALVKAYHLDPSSVVTVYNGIPLRKEGEQTDTARPKKRDHIIKILFVGTNVIQKGLLNLLSAVDLLIKKNYSVNLTVVGALGRAKNSVEQAIQKLSIADNVTLAGYVPYDQIGEYYLQADLFALPSPDESFGLSYIEAMLYGVPVVGSKTGAGPEVITHLRDGVLCDPYNISDITEKLQELIDNESLANKIRINALEKAKKFSVDLMAANTIELYNAKTRQ